MTVDRIKSNLGWLIAGLVVFTIAMSVYLELRSFYSSVEKPLDKNEVGECNWQHAWTP